MTTFAFTIEVEAETKAQAEEMVDEIAHWVCNINNGGDQDAHATVLDDLEEVANPCSLCGAQLTTDESGICDKCMETKP